MAAPAAVTAAIKAAVKILYDSNSRKKFFRFIGSLLGGTVMLIVLILCLFMFMISGVVGLLVNSHTSDNWRTVRVNITDVFDVLEVSANNEVKNALYDFMPEFSTNLSKAAISAGYPNDLLIYDTSEYEKVKGIMENAAATLRAVTDTESYFDFCMEYHISYSETEYSAVINDSVFMSDTGIENASEYSDTVYRILTAVADAAMNNYSYAVEEYETDSGKKATRQTLTVTGEGNVQIVEYNAIGEMELYIPGFIALYQVRLLKDTYLSGDEDGEIDAETAEKKDQAIEDTMGEVGNAENEEEFQEAAKNTSSNKISSTLSFMQIADLKGILQRSFSSGGGVSTSISYENSFDSENRPVSKMIITLEAPSEDEWKDIFEINPDNGRFIAEFQQTVETILIGAGIEETEFYLNLDSFFQNTLFVYL